MDRADAAPGLRSMTGFGAARGVARAGAAERVLEVEARAVNHRHLKVSVRAPEDLAGLVPRLEELARAGVARGALYLSVRDVAPVEAGGYRLDAELLTRLFRELAAVALQLGVAAPELGQVALLPGVVRELDAGLDADALWPALAEATREALAALEAMRRREGQGIGAALCAELDALEALADAVAREAPAAVEAQALRLRQRVGQLLGEGAALDPAAVARELALLADRSDISEEVQRLRSHSAQARRTLAAPVGPVGRELEFLAQELLREANTMASKSHDTTLVRSVLAMKLAVERIREQLANVE